MGGELKKNKLGSTDRRSCAPLLLLVVVAVAIGVLAWGALRQGPFPAIGIETDHPAVGAATKVVARFKEPWGGLGTISLELAQGEKTVTLAEKRFPRNGAFSPTRGAFTAEATLEATVGKRAQDWLKEGEVVLRARADRMHGSLRSGAGLVVEKKLQARFRPPLLELESKQHYVRQGGAGVVVFRVGDSASSSGVRAGTVESLSFPRPGGGRGERFALFAIPWELDDPNQVRLFAEDDAGNRAERAFLDLFKQVAAHHDTIALSDTFLNKVVPEIASQTPGFDATGPVLDQFLRINGEMRRATLAQIVELTSKSEPGFLWRGAFSQMANTQRRASFAENRTYTYQGRVVDHQTHLGLDLASTSHAPVTAANSGKVIFAGWLAIYGNAVILDHGYGLASLYGHLASVAVKPGESVSKGQVIATSDSTGLAGGDHLHLEIFIQGKSVDPLEWLDAHWIGDNVAKKIPLP
jgi:hypothetical protein